MKRQNQEFWILLAPQYVGDPLNLWMEMPVLPPDQTSPMLQDLSSFSCYCLTPQHSRKLTQVSKSVSSSHVPFGKLSRYTSMMHSILE